MMRGRSLRGSVDWNRCNKLEFSVLLSSLPSRERGLKSVLTQFSHHSAARRSLRGSVDWNITVYVGHADCVGRSLRGSVDWNCMRSHALLLELVAPFAGAWIEIDSNTLDLLCACVAPFAGAWIEIFVKYFIRSSSVSRSLRGSVDWNSGTWIKMGKIYIGEYSQKRIQMVRSASFKNLHKCIKILRKFRNPFWWKYGIVKTYFTKRRETENGT